MKILFFISFLFASIIAISQAGNLDTSFNHSGTVVTHFGSDATAFAVAVQQDGKIVAAGTSPGSNTRNDFALARYNTDGTLDNSFGGDGKVTTDFNGFEDEITAIAIQPDAKIIVAGESRSLNDYDFAVARYNSNGTLDKTFGSDGKVTTDFDKGDEDYEDDVAYAMALQTDGKIIVAGQTHKRNGLTIYFAIVRYNSNGSRDMSFGYKGGVVTLVGGNTCEAYGVAVQQDGKIVVAGTAYNGSNYDVAVVRYKANGSLDNNFGTNGKVTTRIGVGDDNARAIALQTDGKIVVAGSSNNGGLDDDFAAMRYLSDGTLDTTFGIGGKVTTRVGASSDYCNGMVIQADGKIILAGQAINARRFSDIGVVRYNSNGQADNTFGTNGVVTTAIGTRSDDGYAVALQPDGKIVVAGDSYFAPAKVGFAVVRYLSSGSIPFNQMITKKIKIAVEANQ